MELNIETVLKWLSAGSIMVSAGVGWLILRLRAEFAPRLVVEECIRRLDGVEADMTDVRAALRSAPTQDDIRRIELTMEKMTGQVGILTAKLEGLDRIVARAERVVERQEAYLMRNGVGS
jgi:hypothetical protein